MKYLPWVLVVVVGAVAAFIGYTMGRKAIDNSEKSTKQGKVTAETVK